MTDHMPKKTRSGSKYNFSGSNFEGAILSFESTVTQYIGANPNIEDSYKSELLNLINELSMLLKGAPAERTEEVEVVAETAKQLIELSTSDKPNKSRIEITILGLKQAAQNIADMIPAITGAVTNIVDFVNKLFL